MSSNWKKSPPAGNVKPCEAADSPPAEAEREGFLQLEKIASCRCRIGVGRKNRLLQMPNWSRHCSNWPRLPINFAAAILHQLKLVGGLSAKFCPEKN
ncbi:hypothetical protein V6N13_131219 [Hibiscus sabdariffa]